MSKPPNCAHDDVISDPESPPHNCTAENVYGQAAPAPRIRALDGWRTVSVGLVIISHLFTKSSIAPKYGNHELFQAWGTMGVRIFFVISGFVICRGLLEEWRKNNSISIFGFYIRRFFRIIPMLWAFVTILCILHALKIIDLDISHVYRGVLFICNIGPEGCGGYASGHLWSLGVEEQFYAIFPLLFIIVLRMARRFITYIFALYPFYLILLILFKKHYALEILSAFVFINAGVVMSIILSHKININIKFSSMAAIIIFVSLLTVDPFLSAGKITTIILYFIEPLMIALMLLLTTNYQTRLARILSSNSMVTVGRASYGIYLWQHLATYPFKGAGVIFYACSLLGVVLLSLLSFKYVERPIIAFGSRLSDWALSKRRPHVEGIEVPDLYAGTAQSRY